jgi:predicted ATPase
VLCSGATVGLLGDHLSEGIELVDLGDRSLLGLRNPERVWAVIGPGLGVPTLATTPQTPTIQMPTSSIVGRDVDLSEVMALVRRHRLVSLVGAAGIGKTRLAREVAYRAPLVAGARLVELADVRDPGAVAATIMRAVTPEQGGDRFPDEVPRLADNPVLVLVDNCEHVVDAAADAIRALLEATAQVRVLATSREALSLASEVVHRVEPLQLPPRGPAGLADVIAAPAVQLLIDRARATRPGLVVEESDVRAMVEIAHLLDGVPLAIELAASGLASTGLGDLARQLSANLETLVDSRRDTQSRHRSLQAALDWTHSRCSDAERALFRRLSTFAHFRTDDVVGVAGEPAERVQTLATLRVLVSKSLIVLEDRDGEAAYRLLQPVRLYAMDRLRDAGELDTFEDRHAQHTLRSAIRAGRGYFVDQASTVAKLRFASGDIELSLHYMVGAGQDLLVADVIAALGLYWFFNDQPTGRRWADHAFAGLAGLDERRRLGVQFASGLLHHGGVEIEHAIINLRAAVDGYERLGRQKAEAGSRFWLGRALSLAGRPESDYLPMFQRAASLADDLGDSFLLAWCQLWLAQPGSDDSPGQHVAEQLTRIIDQARQAGARHPIGQACARLGREAWVRGNHHGARAYLDQAVAIYRELDDRWQLAEQLDSRVIVELDADDLLSAAVDVAEATALSLDIGEERGMARAASVLHDYARATGHDDVAHQLAAAFHALDDRLSDVAHTMAYSPAPGWSRPPRPDLASIVAAPPIDEACRAALADLFP